MRPVLAMTDLAQLQQIIENPDTFVQSLLSASGTYAVRLAITRLRPKIEPALT